MRIFREASVTLFSEACEYLVALKKHRE